MCSTKIALWPSLFLNKYISADGVDDSYNKLS
jgi:hypothetical protein